MKNEKPVSVITGGTGKLLMALEFLPDKAVDVAYKIAVR